MGRERSFSLQASAALREASLIGDLSDTPGLLSQHGEHLVELIARVARLVADRGRPALRVPDSGPLRGPGPSACV
jgi:hypothetical protein